MSIYKQQKFGWRPGGCDPIQQILFYTRIRLSLIPKEDHKYKMLRATSQKKYDTVYIYIYIYI